MANVLSMSGSAFFEDSFLSKFVQLLLGLASVVCLVVLVRRRKRYNLPPGPRGLPLVGYYPFVKLNSAHRQLFELRKKYGPLISMYFGSKLVVVILDFPTLKEAFSQDSFLGRPHNTVFKVVQEAVAFSDLSGKVWRKNRKFVLHVMKELGFRTAIAETHIQTEITEVLSSFAKAKGKLTDIRTFLNQGVSNIVTALIFGHRLDYRDPKRQFLDLMTIRSPEVFKQTSIHVFFPWLVKILVYFRIWNYDKVATILRSFFELADEEVKSHRETMMDGHARDYVDAYLQEMRRRQGPKKEGFSERLLKGNTRTLLSAGTETVRNSLEWALVTMASYPEYQEKVYNEIVEVIGLDRNPSLRDRPRTPLTYATILEVIRWKGIVPLGLARRVTEDTKVLGYDIPKDTIAIPNLWCILNDPDLWEDPTEFRPERFISKDGNKVLKPEYHVPFSYGRRACPAENLAYMELYVFFASIIQKFQVLPPEGNKDLFGEVLRVNLQPAETKLHLKERDTNSSFQNGNSKI